jgi:hypothetical protein
LNFVLVTLTLKPMRKGFWLGTSSELIDLNLALASKCAYVETQGIEKAIMKNKGSICKKIMGIGDQSNV